MSDLYKKTSADRVSKCVLVERTEVRTHPLVSNITEIR